MLMPEQAQQMALSSSSQLLKIADDLLRINLRNLA